MGVDKRKRKKKTGGVTWIDEDGGNEDEGDDYDYYYCCYGVGSNVPDVGAAAVAARNHYKTAWLDCLQILGAACAAA